MNDRKKILFLVTQSEFGGAQRFIYTLIDGLKNYDIVVGAGKEGDDENGLLNLLNKQGIKTERLKNLRRSINPLFDLLGLFEIRKLIKKEQPDILFLCSSKAGFLGSLAANMFKVRTQNLEPRTSNKLTVIYRIGGWAFNDPWPKWKKKMYIWIEKYTAKLKDVIINNAKSDTEQAIKLGIKPRKRIITIHNGIDINALEFFSREEARNKLINLISNCPNYSNQISMLNDQIVGTIANDYPAKGLKYLTEAVKNINNAKCVIIGKGNVFLPDAYKYLKAFDIFVLPSVKEGFPWVILEAMAAEVPVVATRVGAVPEAIEDGKDGLLIDPAKPEQIVEAIERLLKNKELQERLVNNAKKTVIEKFSLNQMINKYIELFEDSDTYSDHSDNIL